MIFAVGPTHRLKPSLCPECGQTLSACAGATSQPQPGDVNICLGCGTPLLFEKGLRLRKLDLAELADAERPELQKAIATVQEYHRFRAQIAVSRTGSVN